MRVGIDIDGVLANLAGVTPPAPAGPLPANFWQSLDEIEPGMVRQLADIAAAERWDVFFLTRRPEMSGASAQVQTERWLERHGFPRPCVHIVRGSRGKVVHALGLDLLIDDTLDNCIDTALESKAASILIWHGDQTHVRRSLRGLDVDIAESLGDAVERVTGRALDRTRRVTVAAQPPARAMDRGTTPTATPAVAAPSMLTRRAFLLGAAVFATFAVYGSLVPLEYRPLSFDEALVRFGNIRYLQLGITSRADFVANILLFIPLGLLLAGAWLVDRPGWLRAWLAVLTIVPLMAALSVAIEFTQVFFPRRTVSLNDIMAETVGGALGLALWILLGQITTNWVRAFASERHRPLLVVRLLAAYVAVFLVAQLMPFDVTIDVGELKQKFDEGRIVLTPLGYAYPSLLAAVWDLGGDVALWIPVGVLATIGWTRPGTHRSPVTAVALSLFCAGLVELAQIFVFTRYAALIDLFTAAAGIVCGVTVTGYFQTRSEPVASRSGHRLWPVGALVVWIGALATYHWAPFDFAISRDVLRVGLAHLWVPPFSNYYFGSEFHAFTELSRKFLLAAPVGALLRFATPAAASVSIARLHRVAFLAIGVIVFSGLEAGQMFLPARTADVTDVVIGLAGIEAGRWVVERLRESSSGLAAAYPPVNVGSDR